MLDKTIDECKELLSTLVDSYYGRYISSEVFYKQFKNSYIHIVDHHGVFPEHGYYVLFLNDGLALIPHLEGGDINYLEDKKKIRHLSEEDVVLFNEAIDLARLEAAKILRASDDIEYVLSFVPHLESSN
jgi:extradiol dioxygenase family protein